MQLQLSGDFIIVKGCYRGVKPKWLLAIYNLNIRQLHNCTPSREPGYGSLGVRTPRSFLSVHSTTCPMYTSSVAWISSPTLRVAKFGLAHQLVASTKMKAKKHPSTCGPTSTFHLQKHPPSSRQHNPHNSQIIHIFSDFNSSRNMFINSSIGRSHCSPKTFQASRMELKMEFRSSSIFPRFASSMQ